MFQLKHYFKSAKKMAGKSKSSLNRGFALFMLGFMGGVQEIGRAHV